MCITEKNPVDFFFTVCGTTAHVNKAPKAQTPVALNLKRDFLQQDDELPIFGPVADTFLRLSSYGFQPAEHVCNTSRKENKHRYYVPAFTSV